MLISSVSIYATVFSYIFEIPSISWNALHYKASDVVVISFNMMDLLLAQKSTWWAIFSFTLLITAAHRNVQRKKEKMTLAKYPLVFGVSEYPELRKRANTLNRVVSQEFLYQYSKLTLWCLWWPLMNLLNQIRRAFSFKILKVSTFIILKAFNNIWLNWHWKLNCKLHVETYIW